MSFLIELTDPHRTLTFETDVELPILHALVQSVSSQLELLTAAVPLTAGVASPSFTFSVASDFYGSSRIIREDEP